MEEGKGKWRRGEKKGEGKRKMRKGEVKRKWWSWRKGKGSAGLR